MEAGGDELVARRVGQHVARTLTAQADAVANDAVNAFLLAPSGWLVRLVALVLHALNLVPYLVVGALVVVYVTRRAAAAY